jgi:AraC-like DNA-binding protein
MPRMDVRFLHSGSSTCRPGWWNVGWKWEPWCKLYRVRSGTGEYAVEAPAPQASPAAASALVPGRLYLIPAPRLHRHRCPSALALDWCHFTLEDPELAARAGSLAGIASWSVEELGGDRALAAVPNAAHGPAGDRLRSAALVLRLLADLPDPADDGLAPMRAKLAPAVFRLTQAFQEDIDVPSLARLVGLSPGYFQEQFRRAHGTSPHSFLLDLRLGLARRLLRDGSEPVQAIAKRCGFSSPVHFSRLFSRHVGSSPQRYRAAWRESLAGGAETPAPAAGPLRR